MDTLHTNRPKQNDDTWSPYVLKYNTGIFCAITPRNTNNIHVGPSQTTVIFGHFRIFIHDIPERYPQAGALDYVWNN